MQQMHDHQSDQNRTDTGKCYPDTGPDRHHLGFGDLAQGLVFAELVLAENQLFGIVDDTTNER